MQLSREYVLKELSAIRDVLDDWIKELDEPSQLDGAGNPVALFPEGVPPNIQVEALGLPVQQLRAELAGLAGRLEALVSAG